MKERTRAVFSVGLGGLGLLLGIGALVGQVCLVRMGLAVTRGRAQPR